MANNPLIVTTMTNPTTMYRFTLISLGESI